MADSAPRKPAAYMCEEMLPFINSCIDKFEKLEQDSIIKTMEAFLKMYSYMYIYITIHVYLHVHVHVYMPYQCKCFTCHGCACSVL